MCLFTTYATSYGIDKLEDWIVNNVLYEQVNIPSELLHVIIESFSPADVVENPVRINSNELSDINVTIKNEKINRLASIYLSENFIIIFNARFNSGITYKVVTLLGVWISNME